MKNLQQITEYTEEEYGAAWKRRWLREQAEKRAVQIEAEFLYWLGLCSTGFIALIIIVGWIVFKGK